MIKTHILVKSRFESSATVLSVVRSQQMESNGVLRADSGSRALAIRVGRPETALPNLSRLTMVSRLCSSNRTRCPIPAATTATRPDGSVVDKRAQCSEWSCAPRVIRADVVLATKLAPGNRAGRVIERSERNSANKTKDADAGYVMLDPYRGAVVALTDGRLVACVAKF